VQAQLFQASTSATLDEVTYLRQGLLIYREGSFEELIDLAAPPLPVLLTGWLPALSATQVPLADEDVPILIAQGRLAAALLIGVPLVLTVACWLAARRGWLFAFLGGGLVAFSPSVVAHASLATTDACFVLFALLALAVLNWYCRQPSPGRFLLLGVSFGLALAAKQSAVFLFVVALVFLSYSAWTEPPLLSRPRRLLRLVARVTPRLAGLVGLAFLVSWALYGFATGPLLDAVRAHPTYERLFGTGPLATYVRSELPVPASLLTFLKQVGHSRGGHPAFLLGATSDQGWWYFFPVAFFLKSTPAELLLVLAAIVGLVRARGRCDRAAGLWWISLVVFFSLTLLSRINIGQRYVLVVYPLLVLCAVDGLAAVPARRGVVAVLGLLLALQVGSAAAIAPQYLSYFPWYVGGPEQGYHYLVDSSLDWGQDLPALRRELDERGYRQVLLSYFGLASPGAYGLRAVAWNDATDAQVAACDWVGISATKLRGVYNSREQFAAFRALTPTARAGFSIFLYRANDPAVRAAIARARQVPADER
jgi:hypothetical protein